MKFLGKLFINTLAIILAAYMLPGVHIGGECIITFKDIIVNENPFCISQAVIIALLIALLNVVLRPVLIILTIPFTLLTFGLFLFFINAIIILIASNIIPNFDVDGFWWAVLFSIVVSVINSVLEYFIAPTKRQDQQF